ncbi:response regulator transcription factor [Microvirga sp. BT688]|uniref:LuxR C-terminal-related transcriptional regulator n=1 Tax=Microvirga sp. TaxID=1873136 RepID=UPI0016869EBE|nr:response regulator transcription factor [Microvirga sp.]MBD2746168.1 response regulator transcription factor [Microvirga sp.]
MATATHPAIIGRASHSGDHSSNCQPIIATALISGSFLIRNGLRRALEGTHFSIVEEGSVLTPERHWPRALNAALFVVDATQSPMQVLEAVQSVRQQCPSARIVALVDQLDLSLLRLGYEAGVDSFCLATSAPEVLINVLELTMMGEKFVPGAALQAILNQEHQPSLASAQREPDHRVTKLSPREAVILHSLMSGDANKVIARKLDITEATIKVHVKAILRKIGAANRTQAAMWATEHMPRRRDP